MASGFVQDPSCYEFALSSGICGDDDVSDVLTEKLRLDRLILFRCLTDHDQLHLIRHHRERLHIPFHVLLIIFFRICQSYQVSQCPGHSIVLSFQDSVPFLITMENPCNVSCHGRLLRNYQ